MVQTALMMYEREGVACFMRGLNAPVVGAAPIHAFTFLGRNYGNTWTQSLEISNFWKVYIAGCIGGVFHTMVAAPFEVLKCRAQV